MGFPKWLKPVGKIGLEVGKAAGQTALTTAVASNPAIALAVQITQASMANGQVATPELVNMLNTLLQPHGYIVVALPARV